jgi:hypothetical protein
VQPAACAVGQSSHTAVLLLCVLVPTPTPVKPPTAAVKPPTSNDVSSSDDDSSDDEGADVIVTVRPRHATKPQGPTAKPASKPFGWGPAPRPRHTFTAKVDYGCHGYSWPAVQREQRAPTLPARSPGCFMWRPA